jgi:hypothetical protein
VLPTGSTITSIDRLQAPYNPAGDQVCPSTFQRTATASAAALTWLCSFSEQVTLAAGLSLEEVLDLLEEAGV